MHVGVPTPLGLAVGMADVVPETGSLAADLALGHRPNLLDAPKYVSRRGGKGARDKRTGVGAAVSGPEGDGARLSFVLMHVIAEMSGTPVFVPPFEDPPGTGDYYGPGDRDVAFRRYPFSPSGPARAMGYNLPVPGNGFPVPGIITPGEPAQRTAPPSGEGGRFAGERR